MLTVGDLGDRDVLTLWRTGIAGYVHIQAAVITVQDAAEPRMMCGIRMMLGRERPVAPFIDEAIMCPLCVEPPP